MPTTPDRPEASGAELLDKVFQERPRASYQPNGLPPIDESIHSAEVVESLQHRAMQVE